MYYFILIISLAATVFWSCYFWKMLTLKKFERFSIIKLLVRYLIPGFLLFAFGFTFVMYAMDLKAVLTHQTKQYSGECEILLGSSDGGEESWIEAELDFNVIYFDRNDYSSIQAGNYYCKVEYYPASSEGVALELYQSENGGELEID